MAHLLRLNQLTTECNQIGKDADEIVATLFEVANLCKELEDEDSINSLKESLKMFLMRQNETVTRSHLLSQLTHLSVEDVVKKLKATKRDDGSQWYNLEQHSDKWKAFEEEIEGKYQAANEEDEDLMFVPTQQQGLAPNRHCPITGTPILELREPVKDSKGYIYEKEAIAAILRSGRDTYRQKKCPVAGAQHMIRWEDLRSAEAQVRLYKRQQSRNQNLDEEDNILDL